MLRQHGNTLWPQSRHGIGSLSWHTFHVLWNRPTTQRWSSLQMLQKWIWPDLRLAMQTTCIQRLAPHSTNSCFCMKYSAKPVPSNHRKTIFYTRSHFVVSPVFPRWRKEMNMHRLHFATDFSELEYPCKLTGSLIWFVIVIHTASWLRS